MKTQCPECWSVQSMDAFPVTGEQVLCSDCGIQFDSEANLVSEEFLTVQFDELSAEMENA